MNGMQFSSSVITVLAWPLVILVFLLFYKTWITSNISTGKLKLGPVEFEWFSEIGAVGQEVGDALDQMPLDPATAGPVPTSLVDLIADVNKNPRSGMRKAFRFVRRALDESYPGLASVTQDKLPAALGDLAHRGVLHPEVESAISQLNKLLDQPNANAVADRGRGYLFLLLAEGAIHGILRSAEIHAGEISASQLAVEAPPVTSSWRGQYTRSRGSDKSSFDIELRISQWLNDTEFEGEMNYPGTGTSTSVAGHLAASPESRDTAITWRETAYLDQGTRTVEFGGSYEAVISHNLMTGKWKKEGQEYGDLKLRPA
jgi:hypothetical protein